MAILDFSQPSALKNLEDERAIFKEYEKSMASNSDKHLKWSTLCEEEKKKITRLRCIMNSKRSREIWKAQDKEMQELYNSNEEKMQKLENMADDLMDELNKSKTSERGSPSSTTRFPKTSSPKKAEGKK